MDRFLSRRERRLWLWAAASVLAIWATLPLSGILVELVSQRRMLDQTFFNLFVVLVAAIRWSGLERRPGRRELWVYAAVIGAYGMLFLRTGLEERSHLFEYGLVGVFIYQALLERRRAGGSVRVPAVLAILITSLSGALDEGIQWFLPNRVFDPIDLGFNAFAALLSVTASVAVGWARRFPDRLVGE
ncbi:MAG: VanZ family protein [Gemmatimonadetes bacterium]|nr:VanZ family protein [Gemmatimonadota bacterium]